MADLSLEKNHPGKIIAGIDEAGRGSWAGPVAVGAVIINPEKEYLYINDSKQMSKKKRKEYYQRIISDHDYAIGLASAQEIVKLGLNNAIFLAMNRAISELKHKPDLALIDGNYKCNIDVAEYISIIKGDSISSSIAAGSIIAKVTRDNLMQELAKELPVYGWERNVGYGTSDHLRLIQEHGVSKYHRTNYKPIQRILEEQHIELV